MKNKSILLLLAVATIMFYGCIPGCDQIFSQAKGQVSNFHVHDDARLVNSDLDYGVTVSFAVQNIGEKGVITVTPKLSCSEGEWTREQTLTFNQGESKNLTYFFQEPTINASNIYGSAKVFP